MCVCVCVCVCVDFQLLFLNAPKIRHCMPCSIDISEPSKTNLEPCVLHYNLFSLYTRYFIK